MRTISDKQGKTLKAATRRSLDQAGGGDAFHHVTRVRANALSSYASANEDKADKFIPVDVAVECDMEANSPIIVAAMAAMLGYKLVPCDAALGPVNPDAVTGRDALKVLRKAADVAQEIDEATQDDHIDAGERRSINREIDELVKTLQCVQRRIGGGA
ncbi:phage regulatory CII family protein [Shinella zoogloeoides]|uniref:phage regulatory CII family protein n=1 Tax=Shinella zoogloeoides TaxID=352475 RepID=UPI0028A82E69|nr:phage regulatory CII family protein [Shinella zoogloeoides]